MSGGVGPLALTMGDPAGIAPELTLKAWRALAWGAGDASAERSSDVAPLCFFAIDDPDALRSRGAPIAVIDRPAAAAAVFSDALPVLPEPLARAAQAAKPDPANAPATLRSLERAVGLTLAGEAGGVVTNPINKKALSEGADFPFPGQTELLAALTGVARSVMMLASPLLRVVPVTIHLPLRAVPDQLTPALLSETLRIVNAAMREDFGVEAPRIAVAGLNPHAGEGGVMGTEERDWMAPTLERLRAEGMRLIGPASADTLFHARAREGYDVAVCPYHDQALIPIKTLDFDRGVNVTLGLPIIRTSPDHGVAYDIAGRDVANPQSLIEAIRLAHQLSHRRARTEPCDARRAGRRDL